jgi:tetratricopeptide (TPR) repeat protein
MPEKFRRSSFTALVILAASLLGSAASARSQADSPPDSAAATKSAAIAAAAAKPLNSELDAPLFYQLLVGEMELRNGQAGVAYQVLLDGARRTSDEELFKRVVNIALQSRAGDQALLAARAWRDAIPESVEAHQMTIQLLALLNRPSEVADALRQLLKITPVVQQPSVLASLPKLFQRSADPKQVYAALLPVLQDAAKQPGTRAVALLVQARMALLAADTQQAMALTAALAKEMPQADETLQLALELMPSQPAAEALITSQLSAKPDNHQLRLAYGRALARTQRTTDAAREFRAVTVADPSIASAWFALGALELDLRNAEAADAALRRYLTLQDAADSAAPPAPAEADAAAEASAQAAVEARQQTWLMLAQAAELRGDLKAADSWLQKVDSPQRRAEAQFRRASLLARQGQLSEARKIIQALPETTPEQARAKLLAEAQLLREAGDWAEAYAVLTRAAERQPDDADLIYEQSMMAEKLGKVDEMETLLKRVMSLKPNHHHAYNALGYSLAERNIRLDEAHALIVKALSFAPAEPFIIDSLGWVEFRRGNKAEAVKLLRQSYAAQPDAEIAAHLGEVLWASDERDEARRIWREGIKREPKNEALRDTLKRLKVNF